MQEGAIPEAVPLVLYAEGAKISWIFIFMILYWGYCTFWGIKGALGSQTASDYFVAGRQLSFWIFIFAATATSFSGWTFMGHPGLTYTDGLQYAFASFYAITIPFTGILFLKRQWMLGKRFGFITPGEMLAYYFNSNFLRLMVVVVALFFSVPYVGIQLRAAGFLFNVLTNNLLAVEFGMWVLSIIVVSYVASGGLRTVAYVDTMQAILQTLGIVIIGLITLYFVGGWERLMTGIAALSTMDATRTPEGYSHYVAIPGVIQFVSEGSASQGGSWTGTMILTYLFGLMGIMASPAFSMWAFASRNPAPFAPQQVWASAFVMGFILIFFTAIQGIGSHFLGADRSFMRTHPELVNPVMEAGLYGMDLMAMAGQEETLIPELIDLLGQTAPWLVGLLAVCALAAMQSTAASYMATAGGILTRDLFRQFFLPNADDRTQKFIGRVCIVVVVILALLVATTATDALAILGGLAVSYGFQMWPALIAICYWPFLTRQGIKWGLLAGLIAVTLAEEPHWFGITAWGRWPLTIHSAGWGILFNFGTAILISLITVDDRGRKMEFHSLLREHGSLPAKKRRLVPAAWLLTLAWFFFAIGPGAVLGNTLFGNPNEPQTWWFGMPSLWVWQILGWILGVAMMWFLAYYMEMSTAPERDIEPLAGDVAHVETPSAIAPAEGQEQR